jgi:hypothetical protein
MTTFRRSVSPFVPFHCVSRQFTGSYFPLPASATREAIEDFHKLCATLSISVWRGVKNSREICTKLLTAMVLRRRS